MNIKFYQYAFVKQKVILFSRIFMLAASILISMSCDVEANFSENDAGSKTVDENLDGVWFEQTYRGVIVHPQDRRSGKQLKLEITSDGIYRGPVKNSDQVETAIEHDAQAKTFVLKAEKSDYEEKYAYDFDDHGVLTVWLQDDDGVRRLIRQYTRNPEGTAEHQRIRKADLLPYGGNQQRFSSESLRIIAWSSYRHSQTNQGIFADSIGHLAVNDWFTSVRILTPWSSNTLPQQFDDLPESEKINWINKHSDYVYLTAGKRLRDLNQIVAFELAPEGKLDQIGIATYNDLLTKRRETQTRRLPYQEANELIKAQTGYSISQWLHAVSPGTGQMTIEDGDRLLPPPSGPDE